MVNEKGKYIKLFLIIGVLLINLKLSSQDLNQAFNEIIITNSIDEVVSIIDPHPDILAHKPTDNRNILFSINSCELWKFEEILKRGADPNAIDDAGWTPFTYNTSNFKLYQILKNYGGKVVTNDKPNIDYLAWLIHNYTLGNQK